MVEIVQKDALILRKKATPVAREDIGSERITDILSRMHSSLAAQDDGVALAAPQIGEAVRIFIVSGKVFSEDFEHPDPTQPDRVFINPVVKKVSRTKKVVDEGCLSVRGIYGKVLRATKASVEAYDEKGRRFTLGGAGLLAQIFQHEIDHLNGILFTDTATDLENVPPPLAHP